jgi:hypothetical protein
MSVDAVIGGTGFVGKILARQHSFAACFNSSNIDTILGQAFDTVVCAAAPGSMFVANREPDRDCAHIEALIKRLDRVRARRFVLISSIAVLADFAAGDDETTQNFQQELAYGRHRRLLEAFCESRFEECLVVRLPALFGPGLRKNLIFDLLNPVPTMLPEAKLETLLEHLEPPLREALSGFYAPDPVTAMHRLNRDALDADPRRGALDTAVLAAGMSATQFHNPGTAYQFYDMSRLWQDISIALQAGLDHMHLTVEPLRVADIHIRLLGSQMPQTAARLHREDMRTRHAPLWGRESPYLEDAATVLDKLADFFVHQKHAA